MATLKDLFLEIDEVTADDDENAVEVFADSVRQALDLAAGELGVDVTRLDYDILEKGNKGFFGIGKLPYRVLVRPMPEEPAHNDLEEIEAKLVRDHMPGVTIKEDKNAGGSFKIRVTKTGVWLTITPPRGSGKPVNSNDVINKLYSMRINTADMALLEKEAKNPSGKPVKIDEWKPTPEFDGTMTIEVTEDEMKAFAHFNPPRYFGRHMEVDDILSSLKKAGVVAGISEEKIAAYLEDMDYSRPLLAAEGVRMRNGRDSYIDYKVKTSKSKVSFAEDESGKVDFRNMELLENVVVGQVLAVKVPAEQGVPGRTVTNRILPAKFGKDIKMPYGTGTILSEDGMELTAEINGQVVFKVGKLSVDPVYIVPGDVSLETGNVVFLGSVIVSGNVLDNFTVKAAGNIEVKGTVQKAFLEAEGDIIVHQGITGRSEAKIESTGGSIFAKFIQNATVIAEGDVIVPEGVMHSNVDAGKRILSGGKKARLLGGRIRAGNEINVMFIGAEASTKTEITVGINPKVLQQMNDLSDAKAKIDDELRQIQLNLKTLTTQKKSGAKFTPEKEKLFEDLTAQDQNYTSRLDEIKLELDELNSYVGMLEHKGKVNAEGTVFPGVEINIKDKKFPVRDKYNHVRFALEGGEINISEYEPPEVGEGPLKMTTVTGRRGRHLQSRRK